MGEERDKYIEAIREHGAFTPVYDKEACLKQINPGPFPPATTTVARQNSLTESVSDMNLGRSDS